MDKDKLIDNLFDAVRNEPALRSVESVEQFVQATAPSTSTSLIVQWLKQNKMNILVSTGGVIVATSIFLFPEVRLTENIEQTESLQRLEDQVEQVSMPESEDEPIGEFEPRDEHSLPSEEPNKYAEEEVREEKKVSTKVTNLPPASEQERPVDEPAPKSPKTVTTSTVMNQKSASERVNVKEHLVVLERVKGEASVKAFGDYLDSHLKSLKHDFNSSANKAEIKKFSLKLNNGLKANFRMQVSGFDKLELHWASNEAGEITNVWYRLDDKEVKELDFSASCKMSVSVKYRHKEF